MPKSPKQKRKKELPKKSAPAAQVPPRDPQGICTDSVQNKEALVFDSLAAAAAGLDIKLSILKKFKREAAPGFRGSRVYASEFLPYYKAKKDQASDKAEEKETLEKRKLRIQCETQEFEFNVKKGQYILVTEAAKWGTELATAFGLELDSVPSTLAPDVVGCRTIAEVEGKIRGALDRVKLNLHRNPWKAEGK